MQPNRELVEEVVKIAVLWETRVGGKRVYDTRVALLLTCHTSPDQGFN